MRLWGKKKEETDKSVASEYMEPKCVAPDYTEAGYVNIYQEGCCVVWELKVGNKVAKSFMSANEAHSLALGTIEVAHEVRSGVCK